MQSSIFLLLNRAFAVCVVAFLGGCTFLLGDYKVADAGRNDTEKGDVGLDGGIDGGIDTEDGGVGIEVGSDIETDTGVDGGDDTAVEVDAGDTEESDSGSELDTAVCTLGKDDQCDDKLECTDDICLDGRCSHSIAQGYCFIEGECYKKNWNDPLNICRYCDPSAFNDEWTSAPSDRSCDDGNWCNGDDTCDGIGNCSMHKYPDGNRPALECECRHDGHWYDADAKLCWQNPPHEYQLAWDAIEAYCEESEWDTRKGWRVPNITELISLIRGCENRVVDWTSKSQCVMVPEKCPAEGECTGVESCEQCNFGEGPDSETYPADCYWDPGLSGSCDLYWSSSTVGTPPQAWLVSFPRGAVSAADLSIDGGSIEKYVRCVRGEL